MITPPPGEIPIRALPDASQAEELDPDALEDASQLDASPAALEAEEVADANFQSLPEAPGEDDVLSAEDLKSDIAASPEEPPEASRRRLASAAALIGSSAGSVPPPALTERHSAPPASAAALLASSSGAAAPGPRSTAPAQPAAPSSAPPPSALPPSASAGQPGQFAPSAAPHPLPPAQASGLSNSNILLGALVVGLLGVVAIMLLNQQDPAAREVVVSPPPAPPRTDLTAPKPAALAGCKLSIQPKRLVEKAYLGVAPRATVIAPGKISLGLAASRRSAIGLSVDLSNLSVTQEFSESPPGTVVAVTPTPDGKFLVTHDKQKRDGAVEFSAGMTLGARGSQLEVVVNGAPTSLGTLPSGDITTPSVDRATGADKSYALVLRSGGQSGKLVFGWLSPRGELNGSLGAISMSDALLGTPSVTAGAEHALVTVATRSSADAYWGITLASAALGQPPKTSKAFSAPAGGAGGEAISPAATALAGGAWLLMWTEGAKGKHQVRAQMLDPDLVAVSKAVNVSSGDSDAGQGTLIASEGQALAVFFTRTPGGAELWGSGLTCQ